MTRAARANPARLSRVVADLFGEHVVAAELRCVGDPALLLPGEARHVQNAAPLRQQEFSAGRQCAHRALAELGIAGVALTVREDRAPCWPPQVRGSITHTAGFCAAVVASLQHVRGLGLDAEVVGSVTEDLWPLLFTAAEIETLRTQAGAKRARAAALRFSAKEAFFKCQHGITGRRLEFQDVAIDADSWWRGTFKVSPANPRVAGATLPCPGRYRFEDNFVITGVTL